MASKVLIIGLVCIVAVAILWLSIDDPSRCKLLHGKNICNYYSVQEAASNSNPNFDEMMKLCSEMEPVPKRDRCFLIIEEAFAEEPTKAEAAREQIQGYEV